MEIATVGKVVVPARIEHLFDLHEVEQGRLAADQVRTIDVTDALVDTGATMLSLPRQLIGQLGLKRMRSRTARTAGGIFQFDVYEPVQLTVQGRECIIEVAEVP